MVLNKVFSTEEVKGVTKHLKMFYILTMEMQIKITLRFPLTQEDLVYKLVSIWTFHPSVAFCGLPSTLTSPCSFSPSLCL